LQPITPREPKEKSDWRVEWKRTRGLLDLANDTIHEGHDCVVNQRKLYEQAQ